MAVVADEGRMGGEIEPETAAALGAVANPDNWRGLSAQQKADLAAEIREGLPKEEVRKIDAAIAKNRERGGRRG